MGAPFVSCSAVPLRVDIAPPRLTRSPGAAGAARMQLLRAAEGVLLRLLQRLGPVMPVGLLVAVSAQVRVRV